MANIGGSWHSCSNIEIEDKCSFLPHLLPNLSRETHRRIERSSIILAWPGVGDSEQDSCLWERLEEGKKW